jgi:hypothetical protein
MLLEMLLAMFRSIKMFFTSVFMNGGDFMTGDNIKIGEMHGSNFIKGNVSGNVNASGEVYNSEQRQTLAESAAEIQRLLKQLEETNPTAIEIDRINYVNDETTPSFKRKFASALQASGEVAIDEFILDSKYLKVAKAAIKGWIKPES